MLHLRLVTGKEYHIISSVHSISKLIKILPIIFFPTESTSHLCYRAESVLIRFREAIAIH